MRGPQGTTRKQNEADHWEEVWSRKTREINARNSARIERNASMITELKKGKRFGSGLLDFDQDNQPIYKGERNRALRGPELARTLEKLHSLTGDPVFEDALLAVRAYGIDQGKLPDAISAIWSDSRQGHLEQVRHLVEVNKQGRKLTVPEAARRVAAEFFIRAATFNEAWDALARDFRSWRKSGYEIAGPDANVGNLGYKVKITKTIADSILDDQSGDGSSQQFSTLHWRRLFREGAIAMSFIGDARTP